MKKIQMISTLVIILSVVVLGALAGKKFISYLEEKVATSSHKGGGAIGSGTVPASSGQSTTLYSSTGTRTGNNVEVSQLPPVEPHPATVIPSPAPVSTPSSPSTSVQDLSVQPADATKSTASPTIDYSKEHWVAFASGDGVNIRDLPSTEKPSKVLFKVSKGTKGFIQERKNGWTKVKWDFNKKVGWTRDDLLICGQDEAIRQALSDGKTGIASLSAEKLQSATKKAALISQTISVAVAKPVSASETVRGYGGNKLPSEGVIVASPFARIRDQPNRQGAEIGRVPKGVTVKIKSSKQVGRYYWFEISYSKGKKEGWTREDNLKF